MKHLLLATTALVVAASASTASAADLRARMPVKAAPVVAGTSWTGCYLGGHVGVGWSRTSFYDPALGPFGASTLGFDPGTTIGVNSDPGVVGGAQIGCDYQFANNWVIGLAGDFTATDLRGVANDPFFAGKNGDPATLRSRTDWLASVTGRFGYSWDKLLVYGKGGAAFAHDSYSLNNFTFAGGSTCVVPPGVSVACNPAASSDRFGWTAGVGVEWMIAPNWSAMIEYNHYGFGSKRLSFSTPNIGFVEATPVFDVRQNVDVVKVGINYRFGSSPVVARY
jgi:outer membrane immunogenic protein